MNFHNKSCPAHGEKYLLLLLGADVLLQRRWLARGCLTRSIKSCIIASRSQVILNDELCIFVSVGMEGLEMAYKDFIEGQQCLLVEFVGHLVS